MTLQSRLLFCINFSFEHFEQVPVLQTLSITTDCLAAAHKSRKMRKFMIYSVRASLCYIYTEPSLKGSSEHLKHFSSVKGSKFTGTHVPLTEHWWILFYASPLKTTRKILLSYINPCGCTRSEFAVSLFLRSEITVSRNIIIISHSSL